MVVILEKYGIGWKLSFREKKNMGYGKYVNIFFLICFKYM